MSGVPFEVVDDVVEEPSLESIDEGLRVSSAKSPPPSVMFEAYFLFERAGASSVELVPKMSLDPPPGGFKTLIQQNQSITA